MAYDARRRTVLLFGGQTNDEWRFLNDTWEYVTTPPDTTPPDIKVNLSGLLGSNGWYISMVGLSWSVSDPESGVSTSSGCDPLTLTSETAGTTVTCSATNGAGSTNSAAVTVKIDKTVPGVACSISPNTIWPPSGKMVPATASVNVTDALSGPAGFTLASVTQNEGDSKPDIQGFLTGTASLTGSVKAERLGSATGRIYTFAYLGSDKAGNTAKCTVTVTVPHDLGK